ncbi:MAG: hypothetical protein U0939_18400 [Pirellulales bacterium]
MSESAKRGEYLFYGNKAWRSDCHNGVNMTDELYHNIGVGLSAKRPDLGRFQVTKEPADCGAFKTPSLRSVVYTTHYMHDGSAATLRDVVEWNAHEGLANKNLDYRFRRIAGQELNEQDKRDLVEFLQAIAGPSPKVEMQRHPQ